MGNTSNTDRMALDKAEQMRAACELRVQGSTYRAIAAEMGISVAWAHQLVHDAIEAVPREAAEDARDLELSRCDAEFARADKIQRSLANADSNDLDSIDRVLRATETKLHVMARRAKYLGLDAPTKTEHTGADGAPLISDDDLLGKLARIAASGATPVADSEPDPEGA